MGIRCRYHKKSQRGLTASRNAGIAMATGDILFFLDDDVELFPDYVEEILRAYTLPNGPTVMGVGGIIANIEPVTSIHRARHYFDVMFLVSGTQEGKVLRSGFSTDYGTTGRPLSDISCVDFLPGGVSSFRREVFESFAFSENYEGYGMGEDKDFSYRVSRKYRLVVNPRARLNHYESPKMRLNKDQETRDIVIGRYRLFQDCIKEKTWDSFFFYYALLGYFLDRIAIALLFPTKAHFLRVKGILIAVRDICAQRTT